MSKYGSEYDEEVARGMRQKKYYKRLSMAIELMAGALANPVTTSENEDDTVDNIFLLVDYMIAKNEDYTIEEEEKLAMKGNIK